VVERGISTVGIVVVAIVVTVITIGTAVGVYLFVGPAGGHGGGTTTPTPTTTTHTTTTTAHTTTTTPTTTTTHTTTTTTPVTYTGGTIRIDSDDNFTGANGVVSGSGTQADPYIIEGGTIDASSCDTDVWPYIKVGIIVNFTSKYFVIRNCRVENAKQYGVGISLGFLSNGKVENCVIENCDTGISLDSCSGVVISGNTIENCEDGISNGTYFSELITMSNNTITGCTEEGIDFHYLGNSSATGNTVRNNGTGIYVSASYSCTISNNTVQGNKFRGIEVSYSGFEGGDNNTISYNDTSNNGDTGIAVYGSYDTISYNTSNGNGGTGIRLDYVGLTDINASYNTVSNNTASGNGWGGIVVGSYCVHNTISNNTCLSNNALGQYYDVCTNPECGNYSDTSKEGKIFPTDQTCIYCGGPISKIPYIGCHDLEIEDQPNILENNTYETSYIE
jgi:parallel beta-helix repeat protein